MEPARYAYMGVSALRPLHVINASMGTHLMVLEIANPAKTHVSAQDHGIVIHV